MIPLLRLGRAHEARAARYLKREGLRILARNVRVGRDEIDLVARDGDTAVIVEVRFRHTGILAADHSVTRAKTQRLLRAWRRLARELRLPPSTSVRFDLVLFDDLRRASWVRDAFGETPDWRP